MQFLKSYYFRLYYQELINSHTCLLDIDDFIYAETLQNIAEGMVEARRQRGYCNRVNCPADEVIFLKNRYKLEIMVRSSRTSVCSLLARCFTQRGQLDYYAEVGFTAMRKYFDTTWPIFVSKKLR